jgi:hypothetical protein
MSADNLRVSRDPGIKQEAADKFQATLTDPGRGKHLWTVLAMYVMADPAVSMDPNGQILMDRENLLTIEGPGCFKCEKHWKPGLERRWCQGVMGLMPS